MGKPIEPWKVLTSRYSFRDRWLAVRSDTVRLGNGRTLEAYHTIEADDWVIAITETGNIVLIEQYRHPVGRTLIELPAGMIDAGGTAEGAARLANQVRTWLALDVRKVADPAPDASESIRLHEMPWEQFAADLRSGRRPILEAPQMASLFLLSLLAQSSTDSAIARLRL